jgi:hypothetical protein
MKDMHTQCKLSKDEDGRVVNYTAWIPDDVAVVGRTVKLKEDDGTWSEGWRVDERYTTLPYTVVAERSQDYKRTRKASDI